jgi:hypothetical protein
MGVLVIHGEEDVTNGRFELAHTVEPSNGERILSVVNGRLHWQYRPEPNYVGSNSTSRHVTARAEVS